jgi:hypothetical protein
MELVFSWKIFKYSQISNVMQIHPVEAKLFHADAQTDMTKLSVTFHNSAMHLKIAFTEISELKPIIKLLKFKIN